MSGNGEGESQEDESSREEEEEVVEDGSRDQRRNLRHCLSELR